MQIPQGNSIGYTLEIWQQILDSHDFVCLMIGVAPPGAKTHKIEFQSRSFDGPSSFWFIFNAFSDDLKLDYTVANEERSKDLLTFAF